MIPGKQLLIEIIKPALSAVDDYGNVSKELAFINSELKTFLDNFNHPKEIENLSDDLLKKILENADDDEIKTTFEGDIMFIKGLATLSKEKSEELKLDKNQLLTLEELKELIIRTISKNEYNINQVKEKNKNQIKNYRQILSKIRNEETISSEEYDIIENIIKLETPNEIDNNLDKIFTYINEFNARKLRNIFTGIKDKKEEEKPILEPQTKKEEKQTLPKLEEKVIEREVLEYHEPEPVEEIELTTFELEESDSSLDIFNFVNVRAKTKSKTKINKTDLNEIKEIITNLGFNYGLMNSELEEELLSVDIDKLKSFASYLKDKNNTIITKIKEDNIYALIYILTKSSRENIRIVQNTLLNNFNIKSSGGELFKIVNYATTIFGNEGSENFALNADLFIKHNVSLKTMIDKNINFLHTNNQKLTSNIKELLKYGANVGAVITNCSTSLSSPYSFNDNLMLNNIEVLKMYGFNIKEFFYEKGINLTLLNNIDLTSKIEQLLEVGLNEHIHSEPKRAGTTARALIIKRIYYAYKNNMEIWNDFKTEYKRLNNVIDEPKLTYNEFLKLKKDINKEKTIITEEEINMIKSDYPIMEIIDEGNRPAIFSDSQSSILKRQTELIFDTQIISRPKTFRVFKYLMEEGFEEKRSLLFALVHNSILEEREFVFINNLVQNIGVDKNES